MNDINALLEEVIEFEGVRSKLFEGFDDEIPTQVQIERNQRNEKDEEVVENNVP